MERIRILPCSQGGRMKIKKVGELKPSQCCTCKYFFHNACLKNLKYVYPNQTPCPYYVTDELSDEIKLDILAQSYIEITKQIDELTEIRNILREAIIRSVERKAVTPNFLITVTKVKQKRLDTNAVKEYLKSTNRLNDFLKEAEYQRVTVKPLF